MIAPDEDVWPRIRENLGAALGELQRMVESRDLLNPHHGFIQLLEARYRAGEELYQREWLGWDDPDRFDTETGQEIADAILYLAMRRVRHPDAGGVWR